MRLEEQAVAILQAPATAIATANVHKVDGAVVFAFPAVRADSAEGRIQQDEGPGTQKRLHPVVFRPDIAVLKAGLAIHDGSFEIFPAFDHAAEEFGAAGIEAGIETDGQTQSAGRRGGMSFRRRAAEPVEEMFIERDIVPAAHFHGIEMIDGAKAVEFVEAGGRAVVLEIREAADVNNKLGAATLRSQLDACLFDIAVREPQALAGLPKKSACKHHNSQETKGRQTRADYIRVNCVLRIQNKVSRRGADGLMRFARAMASNRDGEPGNLLR